MSNWGSIVAYGDYNVKTTTYALKKTFDSAHSGNGYHGIHFPANTSKYETFSSPSSKFTNSNSGALTSLYSNVQIFEYKYTTNAGQW